MTPRYDIALMGLGNVNRALVEIVRTQSQRLTAELGFTMRVTAITDLRFGTLVDPNGLDLDAVLAVSGSGNFSGLTGYTANCDNYEFAHTAPADILVEATFTNPIDGEPALSHVRWGLESGKSVCTTNKGPAAFAGADLKALATQHGVCFEYEGAVMSGTPVIRLASGPLKGVGITGFSGILNGTSNYILGRMESGLSQTDAIKEAQDLGYAEADPTADIGGSDVRLKVTVLTNDLLGVPINPDQVVTEGITGLTPEMITDATCQGRHWKLIGQASRADDGTITASVSPRLLPADHPLAMIGGATNAVMFDTEYLGPITISGPGAGRIETAYALLSDIIAIHAARNKA